MLIGEIDCVLTGAGDEIADCEAAGEGGFSGPTLKESLVFVFRCVPSPLHPHIAVFSARLPTNQVYQSLKLMNGPLVYNNERVVEERAILSVFASPALGFFWGGERGSLDCFVSSQSGRKVLSLLFPTSHFSAICERAGSRRVGVFLHLLHHHYCSCRASASLIMTGQSVALAKCQKQRLCRHYFKRQKWPLNNFLSGPVGPLLSGAQSETLKSEVCFSYFFPDNNICRSHMAGVNSSRG